MKKFLFASLLLISLVGCEHTVPTSTLNGSQAAVLPDGRKIIHYSIFHHGQEHHIYVVEKDISVNSPKGKTRETTVIIDGVKYAPIVEEDTSLNHEISTYNPSTKTWETHTETIAILK